MPLPWKKISSEPVGDFRIFKIRSDRSVSPRTQLTHDFFVIDCVDWVNVIAVTPDRHLVMIEQYRHGSATVELEVPGGMMDARDSGPETAGMRELREETCPRRVIDAAARLVPVAELPELMASGKIRHSLVAVALYHFDLWQRYDCGKIR